MHLSNESLIVIVIVGIVAGCSPTTSCGVAATASSGTLIVGVIGAFVGDWLLPQLGIHLGTRLVLFVANATLGAIVLLILLRLVSGVGRGGWRSPAGRRW